MFFQLDENVPLDNVEKSLHFFQEIYPKHLGNEKIDHAKLLNNHLKVNLAIFDCSDKCDENCYKLVTRFRVYWFIQYSGGSNTEGVRISYGQQHSNHGKDHSKT